LSSKYGYRKMWSYTCSVSFSEKVGIKKKKERSIGRERENISL
jgi:hypothetical protein